MKKINWGTLSVAAACLAMIVVTVYTLMHIPEKQVKFNGGSQQTSGNSTAAFPSLTKRAFAKTLVTNIDEEYLKKLIVKQKNYQKYMLSARSTVKHPKDWLLDVLVDTDSGQLYFDFVSPADLQAHITISPYGGWDIPIERVASEFAWQNLINIPDFISANTVSERFYNTASMRVFQQTSEIIRSSEPSSYTVNVACVRTLKQQETYIVMLAAPTDKFTRALSIYTRLLTTMRPTEGIKAASQNTVPSVEPQGRPDYHPHQEAAPGAPGGPLVKPGEVDKNSGKIHINKQPAKLSNEKQSGNLPKPNYNSSKGSQAIKIKNTPNDKR